MTMRSIASRSAASRGLPEGFLITSGIDRITSGMRDRDWPMMSKRIAAIEDHPPAPLVVGALVAPPTGPAPPGWTCAM